MRTDTQIPVASNGTPTDSADQSSTTTKENIMRNTTSSTPSNGAPTASAKGSTPSAEVAPTGSPPGAAPPEKKARATPQPFSPKPIEARAAKAKERAAGSTHPMVQSDLGVLNAHLTELDQSANGVSLAQGNEATTRAALQLSKRSLRPAVQAVCWVLRLKPGGRKFVNDHKDRSELVTAEKILEALPTSGFSVAAPLVRGLTDAVAPTRSHFDAWTSASTALKAAKARFLAASTATRAAISTLNSAVLRAQVSERLQKPAPATKETRSRKRG